MQRVLVNQLLPVKNEEQMRHLVRYVNFINSRPKRDLHQKGFHTHHIYPKSLAKKNNVEDFDGDWNLIELTSREHFIAHMILSYCYDNYSMVYCFRLMVDSGKYKEKITSRQFEKLKLKESKLIQNKVWLRTETHNVFVDKSEEDNYINKGYYRGRIIREDHKCNGNPGEKNGMYGKTHTDEVKKKLSLLRHLSCGMRVWLNNGVINKNPCDKDEIDFLLSNGFSYGRLNQKPTTKNRKAMNDGNVSKMIKESEVEKYLKLGWSFGCVKKIKTNRCSVFKGFENILVSKEEIKDFLDIGFNLGRTKEKNPFSEKEKKFLIKNIDIIESKAEFESILNGVVCAN